MLRPVTISDGRVVLGLELAERGERCCARALHPDTGCREVSDRAGDRALRHHRHRHSGAAHLLDGERNGHADRHAVGEGRGAVAVHGMPGLHAERHHGRLLGHHPEHRTHAAGHADDERAVSDRHDHPRGRRSELLEDLRADRLVAVELRRLGAVLEERQLVRRRVLAGQLLRLVEIAADPVQLRPQPLEQPELGLARLFRARTPPPASRGAPQPMRLRRRGCRWRR